MPQFALAFRLAVLELGYVWHALQYIDCFHIASMLHAFIFVQQNHRLGDHDCHVVLKLPKHLTQDRTMLCSDARISLKNSYDSNTDLRLCGSAKPELFCSLCSGYKSALASRRAQLNVLHTSLHMTWVADGCHKPDVTAFLVL